MSSDEKSSGHFDKRITVNRFEVIDHRKAAGNNNRIVIVPISEADCEVSFDFQDDGKTLKVFVSDV